MERKLSLKDCSFKNKKALIRVDFNVPLGADGCVSDDTRIKASLPTIKYILNNGGSVILMSHLGRPKNGVDPDLSLKPCADRLTELLGIQTIFTSDCVGPDVKQAANRLKPGEILVLENLRFHKGEENVKEDPSFAKELASLGDVYVNDAFGTAHRVHASTVEVVKYFAGQAVAGFLMEKEIDCLSKLLLNPDRPFCTMIGGAKISSKIGVLKSLIQKVDTLLIGGAMAYTFLKAQGFSIGDSLCEDGFLQAAKELIEQAKQKKIQLLLPLDHIVVSEKGDIATVKSEEGIPSGYKGVDIGPLTISTFINSLNKAKTILWNGPLGLFEDERFANGTKLLAESLAMLKATTVIGGGDTIAAVQQAGVAEKMTHLSTGGGATLEFLEFGTLPGIEALLK